MSLDKETLAWIGKMHASAEPTCVYRFGDGPYGVMEVDREHKTLVGVGFDTAAEAEAFGEFTSSHTRNFRPSDVPDHPQARKQFFEHIAAQKQYHIDNIRYAVVHIDVAITNSILDSLLNIQNTSTTKDLQSSTSKPVQKTKKTEKPTPSLDLIQVAFGPKRKRVNAKRTPAKEAASPNHDS